MKTVQEACDFVVEKLVKQGTRCVTGDGNCTYDDGRGNHCAIGWLLKAPVPEDYKRRTLNRLPADILPELVSENLTIFGTLQDFHDSSTVFGREFFKTSLDSMCVDTSKQHWQQWIDLAEEGF